MSKTKYDYIHEIADDVLQYAKEYQGQNISLEEFQDECFISDSVTGNISGSYYCNAGLAQESISELIWDEDFWAEYGYTPSNIVQKGPEAADVIARCILLSEVFNLYETEIRNALGIEVENED